VEFETEELLIREPFVLARDGFDLVVGTFQRAVRDRAASTFPKIISDESLRQGFGQRKVARTLRPIRLNKLQFLGRL